MENYLDFNMSQLLFHKRILIAHQALHNFNTIFEVLMAVNISIVAFWIITPCSLAVTRISEELFVVLVIYHRFR